MATAAADSASDAGFTSASATTSVSYTMDAAAAADGPSGDRMAAMAATTPDPPLLSIAATPTTLWDGEMQAVNGNGATHSTAAPLSGCTCTDAQLPCSTSALAHGLSWEHSAETVASQEFRGSSDFDLSALD